MIVFCWLGLVAFRFGCFDMFSFSFLTLESWSQGFQLRILRFHPHNPFRDYIWGPDPLETSVGCACMLFAHSFILCISTDLGSCKLYMFNIKYERSLLRAKRIPFTQRPARPYLYMILCSSSQTFRHSEVHTLQPGFPASLGGWLLQIWIYKWNDQAIAPCQKYPSNII